MQKDFTDWHHKKSDIQSEADIKNLYFKDREVWWCSLGLNIGFEQDGKGEHYRRPVLIIKKFNQYVVLVVPLTSKHKIGKYYIDCPLGDEVARMAIISQLRLIDTKRLIDKMGVVKDADFSKIKEAIKSCL